MRSIWDGVVVVVAAAALTDNWLRLGLLDYNNTQTIHSLSFCLTIHSVSLSRYNKWAMLKDATYEFTH